PCGDEIFLRLGRPCRQPLPEEALFYLVHIVQHATRHTDRENGQTPLGLVLDAAGHVDDHARMQLNLLIVEYHGSLAGDHVIEFVGPVVVVQPSVLDLNVMDLTGGAVLLINEAANLTAGFHPGRYFRRIAAQEASCRRHWRLLGFALMHRASVSRWSFPGLTCCHRTTRWHGGNGIK